MVFVICISLVVFFSGCSSCVNEVTGGGNPGGSGMGGNGGGSPLVYSRFTDGNVTAMAFHSQTNTLYIGGNFTLVYDKFSDIARLSASTAEPFPFPSVSGGPVLTVAPDGSGGWYIGGQFNQVDGQTRNHVARILSNGTLDPNWNPNADGAVTTIAVGGGKVFVGGNFNNIGGQARPKIAALNTTSGLADPSWNANAPNSATITVIATEGNDVYVGGAFSSLGNQPRNNVARLSATDGNADMWDPNVQGGSVSTLAVGPNAVYLGGTFTSVNNPPQTRNNFAEVDKNSGTVQNFAPNPNNSVLSLLVEGQNLYVGGNFTQFDNQAFNYVVAIDLSSNSVVTNWNPNPDNFVSSIGFTNQVVYLGGDFTQVNNNPRNGVAAVSASSGTLLAWDARLSSSTPPVSVSKITALGNNLVLCGNFDKVNAHDRNNLAAIDMTTGLVKSWNPNPNDQVYALKISGSTLYVGGAFTSIGNTQRNLIASFDFR